MLCGCLWPCTPCDTTYLLLIGYRFPEDPHWVSRMYSSLVINWGVTLSSDDKWLQEVRAMVHPSSIISHDIHSLSPCASPRLWPAFSFLRRNQNKFFSGGCHIAPSPQSVPSKPFSLTSLPGHTLDQQLSLPPHPLAYPSAILWDWQEETLAKSLRKIQS